MAKYKLNLSEQNKAKPKSTQRRHDKLKKMSKERVRVIFLQITTYNEIQFPTLISV